MALGGSSARATRLWILLTVVLNVVIALVLAGGLVWLAGRPGLRQRVDLTLYEENTLDENARSVLDNLPAPVEVDVFFRPFERPLDAIGAQVQGRMYEILVQAAEQAPGKVRITNHPFQPAGEEYAELVANMRRLGISDLNCFVISQGERRTAVSLLGDVAEVDLGVPSRREGAYRPPSLLEFRGQEALVEGILRVTQGERPLLLFSTGQGERAIFESGEARLGRLHTTLAADGFRIENWDPREDGAIPEECAVLAIVGPEEPFTPEAAGWIADYVRGGGSVIAAPGLRLGGGAGSVPDILAKLGVLVQPGVVCQPVINAAGLPVQGVEDCAQVLVRASGMRAKHPVTGPLRRGDRRVLVPWARALQRGEPPAGAVLIELLRSSEYTWEDFPNAQGEFEYRWDQGREREGPFTVAMSLGFEPLDSAPIVPGTNSERRECRVLAIGSPEVFVDGVFDTNRDFLLNAFNWASEREFRVAISPRRVDDRRLAVGQDRSLFWLGLVSIWGLPLVCVAFALLAAWRRMR